ncbi:glycosylphosphatidylinositol anchor attachment 1 protein [Trichonephila inaurata madagascariensis]|uniref:Glycosylphosphatidylinositol anchor attachment 1 protein n=1 Tax=Trichonephila inaurata madagascariensis TaxID=2747483 RepID=A0A8X6YBC5_9ARAC|nr:glycosylphosphatidylinositol anchor attachment 1 protein [Trichonephila inaurata madagascariensis]
MGLLNDSKSQKKMSAILVRHSQKLIALSFLCGIIWFAILASDVFNNKTYFSENALLPGLVVREFNPRSSLSRLLEALKEEASAHPSQIPSAWIQGHFRQLGLDVYQNNFTVQYPFGSKPVYRGNNLYAVLRAPKVASTEAIVITTPYRDYDSIHDNTLASIALMIELAQTFRKHAYWSKDIIFLVTEHENIGFQAWLDAYHDVSTSDYIMSEKLQSTSGLIQGVINLELSDFYFSHVDIKIEGLHGQLPNLDLFNLAVELCIREEIPTSFQSQFNYFPSKVLTWKSWLHNYITMSRMILLQATGLPSAGHGLFHRFGIQALTVKSIHEKRSNKDSVTLIQMGRVIEGTVRSLNNLLEKFHQSFFFYLLPSARSYVSIGLYIPPFALIALPVLIKALYLYLNIQASESNTQICPRGSSINYWIACDIFTLNIFFGLTMLFSPMYLTYLREYVSFPTEDLLYFTQIILLFTWFLFVYCFNAHYTAAEIEFSFKMCTVLLMLGGFLFTLALVNISFALILALFFVPISITLGHKGRCSFLQHFYLLCINPFVFTYFIVVCQSYVNDHKALWWNHLLRAVEGHKKLILFTVEDMYLFGNWNYKIMTLIILPLWFSLYSLKFLKSKSNV